MDSHSTTQVLRTSALLFVDISGSRALYEELGDKEAHSRIDQRLLQRSAVDHGGQVVKSTGDGLLCDFGDPDRALHAAQAMQFTMFASPEFILRGRGRIALGRPTADASVTVVQFFCE